MGEKYESSVLGQVLLLESLVELSRAQSPARTIMMLQDLQAEYCNNSSITKCVFLICLFALNAYGKRCLLHQSHPVLREGFADCTTQKQSLFGTIQHQRLS